MIKSAELIANKPPWMRSTERNKIQDVGLMFEKKVAMKIKMMYPKCSVLDNAWIKYLQEETIKWCSPDLIILPADLPPFAYPKPVVYVVECKLKSRKEAHQKLKNVYKPVVDLIWPGCRVRCVQVCKMLRAESPDTIIKKLEEATNAKNKYTLVMRGV